MTTKTLGRPVTRVTTILTKAKTLLNAGTRNTRVRAIAEINRAITIARRLERGR